MRTLMTFFLIIGMLFSVSTVTMADIFKISPEIVSGNFEVESGSPSVSDSQQITMYYLNAETNFILIRTGFEYGIGDLDSTNYSTLNFRIGTEIPLGKWKTSLFGGYQANSFNGDEVHAFSGVVIGVGEEYKFSKIFSVSGLVMIPVTSNYFIDDKKIADEDVTLRYAKVNLIFTPLPLVDYFIGYRVTGGGYEDMEFNTAVYGAGLRIGF